MRKSSAGGGRCPEEGVASHVEKKDGPLCQHAPGPPTTFATSPTPISNPHAHATPGVLYQGDLSLADLRTFFIA